MEELLSQDIKYNQDIAFEWFEDTVVSVIG